RTGNRGAVIGLAAAQHGAAVGTGIYEGIELTVFGPSDHDRLAANIVGVVVTNVGNLGLMRKEDSVALEDIAHFQVKEFLICENLAVDADDSFFGTVVQCIF